MTKEKKKIELIKLTIQIGDTKVNVTKDEARDLHKALSEMFGEKVTHEHHYSRPWYWPSWQYYGGVHYGLGSGLIGSSSSGNSLQGLGASASDDRPQLTYTAGNNVSLCAAEYREID